MKLRQWLRLARPRQWSKNLLLFAGLIFAGRFRDLQALGQGDVRAALTAPAQALLGFVSFVLLSSSVYALNDLRDADDDRRHPVKRLRPVAADLISKREASVLSASWAVLGLGLGAVLGPRFFALAAAYLALSTLYSLWTKHQVILDVLSLAAGFVLRADFHLVPGLHQPGGPFPGARQAARRTGGPASGKQGRAGLPAALQPAPSRPDDRRGGLAHPAGLRVVCLL